MNAIWMRVNTLLLALVLVALLAVIALLATRATGGPLDPTGPPASTQATQISSIPFTINAPGSYVVTRNLVATNSAMNGITIATGAVTLDLNGFELRGVAGGGGGDGISIPALNGDVVIKSGVVRFWSGDGIRAPHTVRSVFSDLIASQNGGAGIVAASGTTIRNVVANENDGDGIVVLAEGTFYSGGGVFNSQASNNAINGISWNADEGRIEGNVASANGSSGLWVAGALNHVEGNTAMSNAHLGIDATQGVRHTIIRNVAAENAYSVAPTNSEIHFSTNGIRAGDTIHDPGSDPFQFLNESFANVTYDD